MSSKKKTKSTSTTTPNVPDWLMQPAQGFASSIDALKATGPAAFMPETSALQTQAWDSAKSLTPSANYGSASDMVKGADTSFDPGNVQGESLLSGLSDYYTPFRDQVRNPVLADYDVNSGKVRAAQAASGARNQAFRGDRFALREGATEGELARGRAATDSGLLSAMHSEALNASNLDAARRQSAAEGNAGRSLTAQTAGTQAQLQGAGLLSNIGAAEGADKRSNVDIQDRLGGEASDAATRIKQFPMEFQQALEGLFSGINPGLFTGSTTVGTGTSSAGLGSFLGDYLLAAISGGSKAASAAAGGG